MWNNKKSGCCGKKCRTYGRTVGKDNGNAQHYRSIFAKLGDGWSDKTKNDQRNTEGDNLAQNVLDCNNNIKNCHGNSVCAVPVQNKPGEDTQDYSHKEFKRQTFEKRSFFHWKTSSDSIK